MDRAGLAVEPAAVLLEHAVCPVKDAAEALDGVAIPRGMLDIFWKRRRHWHAERMLEDLDVDLQIPQRPVQPSVELGDRDSGLQIK